MCGILGGIGKIPSSASAINFALETIQHRGPDDCGVSIGVGYFIGMRRLAIIDVVGGHQPMFNEDRTIAVVFNGEIYNYKELIVELEARGHRFETRSDTEALVHLYEEYGVRMLGRLQGMFAFAIWDGRNGKLFLARDRFGKKPLYYTQLASGGILFASEIKALRILVNDAGSSISILDNSVYDYLSLGFIPQPATIFREIVSLPPANWLTCDLSGNISSSTYWTLDSTQDAKIGFHDAVIEVRRLIAESVKLRLRSDVPIGVLLSGGIDSTIVAYEAARLQGNVQSFTFSSDDKELDETELACRTAKEFRIPNSVFSADIDPIEGVQWVVRHFDQPFSDSSALPTRAIALHASSKVKVVLTGDGGDEIFGGYQRYRAAAELRRVGEIAPSLRAILGKIFDNLSTGRRSRFGILARFLNGTMLPEGSRYISWSTDMLRDFEKKIHWKGANCNPTEELILGYSVGAPDDVRKLMNRDIKCILASDLLVKMDMSTMFASVEARSPLLDHKLAEFIAKIPTSLLMGGASTKGFLREAYRNCLPHDVIMGRKKGFEIPMERWLRGEMRNLVMDTVGAPSARILRFLDKDLVNIVIGRKKPYSRNWTYILYSFLILELWLREQEK